jgi:HTH-type transcriptional regulator/antitoxin HigA
MARKLTYKIIKTKRQYFQYCRKLEQLLIKNSKRDRDEIELLTLLIEKYDDEQTQGIDLDPIEILKQLMKEHNLIAKDLVKILSLSKGTVSKILNYQKGLSKTTIRTLSDYFKMNQETFNQAYKLKSPVNRGLKDEALMNTKKELKQSA